MPTHLKRRRSWTAWSLCFAVCADLSTACAMSRGESEPLRVQAKTPAGTYYPGQAIELTVGVVAGELRPEIRTPAVPDAAVAPAGTSFRPVTTSAIGDLIAERNLYIARFRIVPTRAGSLIVPPVVARLDGRTGRSEPIRLTIARLPADRPAEFLGGVGTFELRADANPAAVRLGQEFEYRINVIGPAARGMTENPALGRFDKVPLALRIDSLPSEPIEDPPSRTFRFRIRPTRVGEATLPPIAIAAFDPKIKRYVTKVTAGVHVRVLDVPRYDAASLDYATRFGADATSGFTLLTWVGGASTALLAGALGALRLARRIRARRGKEWRAQRLLARLQRELESCDTAARTGKHITEGTAAYLRIVADRPPGALTPREAEHAIAQCTGSDRLAGQAEQLITLCDRAQFSGGDSVLEELIADARNLFSELERVERQEEEAEQALADRRAENTGRGSRGRPVGGDGSRNMPLQTATQQNHRQPTTDVSDMRD